MPETSAQDISGQAATIIAALGGGGVVGAFFREALNFVLGRGKHDAEARKINAEAEKALNELVDDRIRILLEAEANASAQLRSDLAKVWRYVELLRAHAEEIRTLLIKAGIEAPKPPAFDPGPETPRQMPQLTR